MILFPCFSIDNPIVLLFFVQFQLGLKQTQKTIRDNEAEIAALRQTLKEREATISEQEQKIRDHETQRRKLHNTIQELKVWYGY